VPERRDSPTSSVKKKRRQNQGQASPRGTLGATFKRSVQFRAEALEYVAGYLVNDVSERKFQIERCGHWVKGRSRYTFDPIGPRLVTVSGYNRPHPQRLM
jgi:Fumarylacetoacetate (FAA) hydrolase family